ncbi:hypothetical protein [Halorussus halophilus]|uniref:hypothetical protein n=1 Tax=Halorussus halophilus TaxID=2650975 RepID=UPI0013011202|nr:hypothetical protein [Halorussus halophilus]
MATIIQNVLDMVGYFTDVALSDPISAVLLALGAFFVAASSAVMGYLTLGAALDAVVPDISAGGKPPQQG